MAYANLESGDRASSSLEAAPASTVNENEPAETNGVNQFEFSSTPTYHCGHDGAVLIQFGDTNRVDDGAATNEYPTSVQQPIQLAGTRYVLSPSPSFDPVFDDLLEGGTGSGTSSAREQASTKSENASMDESARKIEYLNELLRDEKRLNCVSEFHHLRQLVSREIERVRSELRLRRYTASPVENFIPSEDSCITRLGKFNLEPLNEMPPDDGPIVTVVEKVYAPIEEHPTYNFIGRLVGPRGRTVKQIEQESGCQITIRGRGSERSSRFEGRKRGQLGYEHQNEKLHVRIAATDHKERAVFKVCRAKRLIQQLMVPVDDDELKQQQLRELAYIRFQSRRRSTGPWTAQHSVPADDTFAQVPPSPVPTSPHVTQNSLQFPVPPVVGNLYYIDATLDADGNGYMPMVWPHSNAR